MLESKLVTQKLSYILLDRRKVPVCSARRCSELNDKQLTKRKNAIEWVGRITRIRAVVQVVEVESSCRCRCMKLTRDVEVYKCMCALDACDSTTAGVCAVSIGGMCVWKRVWERVWRGLWEMQEINQKRTCDACKRCRRTDCFLIRVKYEYSHSQLQRLKNAINLRRKTCTCKRLKECVCVCV